MTEEFDAWLGDLAAGDEAFGEGVIPPHWRQWLEATFQEWGPVSAADLKDLAEMEGDRLAALQLAAARRLVQAVIADATAVGMTLDVVMEMDDFGTLVISSRPEPGSRYYRSSTAGPTDLFMTDAELLAWVADEVQEATMERDQIHCFVWPTCKQHQLGGHASVDAGVAVWSCNGGGGHVMAAIGELETATSVSRQLFGARQQATREAIMKYSP